MDARIAQKIGCGNRVLDLGCGSGEILSAISENFSERIGFDVSRRRLETGNHVAGDWKFVQTDLNAPFPIEDEFVDVVVANQVIEHIVDPFSFVGEIYRILRPNGRCVLTTPNIRYVRNLWNLAFSGRGPRTAGGNTLDGDWDDGHLHYFTHKDLRELLAFAGFPFVETEALILDYDKQWLRYLLDKYSRTYLIREFFSGNIILWATKT